MNVRNRKSEIKMICFSTLQEFGFEHLRKTGHFQGSNVNSWCHSQNGFGIWYDGLTIPIWFTSNILFQSGASHNSKFYHFPKISAPNLSTHQFKMLFFIILCKIGGPICRFICSYLFEYDLLSILIHVPCTGNAIAAWKYRGSWATLHHGRANDFTV